MIHGRAEATTAPRPMKRLCIPKPRVRWPHVSVIVPTRDAPQHLGRCLESIFSRSTYPSLGVILVDNGTTDPAARRLFEQYPVDVLPFDDRAQARAALAGRAT